jgi:hypothetical protein
MATRLATFAELLGDDSNTADNIRKKYAAYIAGEQTKIHDWETKKGLKPSGDLIADMKKRIDEINDIIRKKQNEALEKRALRRSGDTDTRWLPVLWLVPIAGAIAFSVVAAKNLPEAKALEEEVQGFLDQLKNYQQLNTLQIWFDAQKETFNKLISNLNKAKGAAENLRGQWQKFTNDLGQLVGTTESKGKLSQMKHEAEEWQKPINFFTMLRTREIYEAAKAKISIFQTSAFRSAMPVEVVQPKAA